MSFRFSYFILRSLAPLPPLPFVASPNVFKGLNSRCWWVGIQFYPRFHCRTSLSYASLLTCSTTSCSLVLVPPLLAPLAASVIPDLTWLSCQASQPSTPPPIEHSTLRRSFEAQSLGLHFAFDLSVSYQPQAIASHWFNERTLVPRHYLSSTSSWSPGQY